MDKSVEDPLVAKAFDASQHEALAHAIQKLSSDEAQFFLGKLERALRKRKIQITGYLVAMLVWAVGMFFGLVWAGTHDGFTGWVYLMPFLLVGAVLWAFGRWADKVGGPSPPATKPTSSPPAP